MSCESYQHSSTVDSTRNADRKDNSVFPTRPVSAWRTMKTYIPFLLPCLWDSSLKRNKTQKLLAVEQALHQDVQYNSIYSGKGLEAAAQQSSCVYPLRS